MTVWLLSARAASRALVAAGAGSVVFLLVRVTGANARIARVTVEHTMEILALGGAAALAGYLIGPGARNDARAWLRFAGRIALVATSLAVAALAAEVAFRVFLQVQLGEQSLARLRAYQQGKPVRIRSSHPLAHIVQLSADPALVFELQPSLDLEFGHRRVRTNREGMRESRDYPHERAPGTVRILGIGDSGMFGWDVEQDEDYLSVLETKLNEGAGSGRYEVLNLAVPGYNTQLEVESLRHKGLAYRPDVVIVGWCENDFYLPFFVRQEEDFWRRDLAYLYYLLFDRGRLADVIQGGIHDRRTLETDRVAGELTGGTDVEGVTRAFRELQGLAAEHRFRVLVFGAMRPRMVEVCRRLDLDCLNTYEAIPPDRYPAEWAVYYMHPSPEGHRVLGELLAIELEGGRRYR